MFNNIERTDQQRNQIEPIRPNLNQTLLNRTKQNQTEARTYKSETYTDEPKYLSWHYSRWIDAMKDQNEQK